MWHKNTPTFLYFSGHDPDRNLRQNHHNLAGPDRLVARDPNPNPEAVRDHSLHLGRVDLARDLLTPDRRGI